MQTQQNREKSLEQYDSVIINAKEIVLKKSGLYGQSWEICRPFSMLDQAGIKIQRIRTIQENAGVQRVTDEPIADDFRHIINYCIFGLILLNGGIPQDQSVAEQYDIFSNETRNLFEKKNHDYGEAWRELAISSMTDLMLMKLMRAKYMHKTRTDSKEALNEIFKDILNYAVFCRIKISEGEDPLL